MNILHWKRTTIAEAPDELSKAINKYTNHNSQVQKKGAINGEVYDVVHFHNKIMRVKKGNPKKVVQYHSEPHRVDFRDNVDASFVISQYHATLPEYSKSIPVRNIIDFENDLYEERYPDDKIKVTFSPSAGTNNGYWYNKGVIQTKRVLERLESEYPSDFDFEVIQGESLQKCIEIKSKSNVVIDECVTPSYHRSGLEGLALGKYTICSIHPEVEEVMLEASGAESHPFFDVDITNLYSHLKNLIEKGPLYVCEEGRKSRNWMEKNWSPKEIASSFVNHYEEL